MVSTVDRRIWLALQNGEILQAYLDTRERMPNVPTAELPLWACVLAATPINGSTTISEMARAIPNTSLHPDRALYVVVSLAHAIQEEDWHTAVKMIGVIRTYAPSTGRGGLVHVLRRIISGDHATEEEREELVSAYAQLTPR